AVRLFIDSWRWADVPFYVRAGKRLPVTCTEVLVRFHRPPQHVYGKRDIERGRNHVRFRLSPEVVIAIGARDKKPGEEMVGEDVELTVTEHDPDPISPYERLLTAAIHGDSTLFAREDSVEAAWTVVDPVLRDPPPVFLYEPGTWGPPESARLLL